MKKYSTFDQWAEDQSPKHRRLISRLKRLVSAAAPSLVETSKWGNGCWEKDGLPLVFVHAKESHLQFGFFAGAQLRDPQKLLVGGGKFVRHIPIETQSDIDETAFATMVRRAVRAPAYK